jgi:hypothetical protein
VLAFISPSARCADRPPSKAETRERQAAYAQLQGVWEQMGQLNAKGRLEERKPSYFALSRHYLVVAGPRVYTIMHAPSISVFKHEDITLHPGGNSRAIDFVDPTSNRTVRGLYDVRDDTLRLCYRVRSRRTLQRPGEIAPTRDGFDVLSFQKVNPPEAVEKSLPAKENDPLAGVWNTVGFETNGVKLEEQEPIDPLQHPLRDKRRVCFFRDGVLTMFHRPGRVGIEVSHWAYLIDGRKVTFTKPNGTKVLALFEATDDRLSICFSEVGGRRPDQLRTWPGDDRWLLRLERADESPDRARETDER